MFASYTDPKTPHVAGSVNQLLGINNTGAAVGFYNDTAGDLVGFYTDAAGNTHGMLATP